MPTCEADNKCSKKWWYGIGMVEQAQTHIFFANMFQIEMKFLLLLYSVNHGEFYDIISAEIYVSSSYA